MKRIPFLRISALLLLAALAAPLSAAARDHAREGHRNRHAERHGNRPEHTSKQSGAWQKEEGWHQHRGWTGNDTWRDSRSTHWKDEHYTWAQRGGYGGYYVRRDRYRLYFGRDHFFRIHERPVIYRGYPRFYYQGYSFLLVDPYPETWEENWYETDDVYIIYDNGYYLYNRNRPGYALAITVIQ